MSSSDDEEGEDKGQVMSTPYAVIGLCIFLLSWQASFRVPDIYMGVLLAFMHHFVLFISAVTHSEQLSTFSQRMLCNSGLSQAMMLIISHNWLCVPICHSIYDLDPMEVERK